MTQKNNFNMVSAEEMISYIEEQGLSYDHSLGGSFHNTESLSVFPFPGSGYAMDMGLILIINDKLSSSIAITNLLGHITWGNSTTYEHKLRLNSQLTMEDLQEDPESALYSGLEIDTNIAVTPFKTKYPSTLILGAEYSLEKIWAMKSLKIWDTN